MNLQLGGAHIPTVITAVIVVLGILAAVGIVLKVLRKF